MLKQNAEIVKDKSMSFLETDKDFNKKLEERVMHSKGDDIEIITLDKAEEATKELFESPPSTIMVIIF